VELVHVAACGRTCNIYARTREHFSYFPQHHYAPCSDRAAIIHANKCSRRARPCRHVHTSNFADIRRECSSASKSCNRFSRVADKKSLMEDDYITYGLVGVGLWIAWQWYQTYLAQQAALTAATPVAPISPNAQENWITTPGAPLSAIIY
jgi:hypothetical protein